MKCFYRIGLLILLAVCVQARAEHPKLLFGTEDLPSIRQKVQSGWLKEAFDEMKINADGHMAVSTNPYPIAADNGYATAGRAINERVNTLALTGFILEDSAYIQKAIDMCMSLIAQTDVNDFYDYNGHLAIGDATHAYAVAYDWLYNDMTVSQRDALYQEMIEFGTWLYDDSMTGRGWGNYSPTPLSCNHNSVHHGGLGLAGLVSGNSDWVDRAAMFVDGYFQYARDITGYNMEGIGYYGYGSLGAIPFSVAYQRAGLGDLVDARPRNQLIPEWLLRFIQPWGDDIVALNDSQGRLDISSGMIYLAGKYQDGTALWTWLRMFDDVYGDGTYGGPESSYIGMGCTLPYIIIFADPDLQPVHPADAGLPFGKFFERGSGSFRSSWQDDAALATFTCGFDQHRGHNHRDENSFTFSAYGKCFVYDPTYNPDQTRAHNTILVDGVGQDHEDDEYDTYGQIVATRDFGTAWYMKGDAKEAYRDFLNLTKAFRQFLFVKAPQPYIVIADDITNGVSSEFTWLLHTKRENIIAMGPGFNEFTIRGPQADSAVCWVKLLNPSSGLNLYETDLTGLTFEARDRVYEYEDYFKEVQAVYTGINPKFKAILIAAPSLEALPSVQTIQASGEMVIKVLFSDGSKDTITVTDETMDYVHDDPIEGDFNLDGIVDYDDLSTFVQNWMNCSMPKMPGCVEF